MTNCTVWTQIKTNDALVVGIFEKKGSKEEGAFRQVAKDMAPDGGILFAVTYDAKVAKKYLDDGPPAVAAFTNFDPETGHSKKHVKGKAFTTDFEYAALYTWAHAEALPCVTRVPINMGPDASKRNRVRPVTGWFCSHRRCDCASGGYWRWLPWRSFTPLFFTLTRLALSSARLSDCDERRSAEALPVLKVCPRQRPGGTGW